MASNWNAPPPPPPPPGPPPPSASGPAAPSGQRPSTNNYIPPPPNTMPAMQQQASAELEDKNAAYLARMRGKQHSRSKSHNTGPKINLLGGINPHVQQRSSTGNIDLLGGLSVNAPAQKRRSSKHHVQLPSTGLSERELFSKYKIEDNHKIGQGAFARIKVVKAVADGTKFALKMVKKKGRSKSDIEAFKKEILFLSKLTNHPNIIKMYDFCDSPQGILSLIVIENTTTSDTSCHALT